jgi:hypothetical protein
MIALIIHARLFRDRQREPEPVCRFDQIIVGGGGGGLGRRIQDIAAKGTRNRDRSGQCGGIVEHPPLSRMEMIASSVLVPMPLICASFWLGGLGVDLPDRRGRNHRCAGHAAPLMKMG